LERILPDHLRNAALVSETSSELVLPYAEALAAIVVATNHQIAVLGVDAYEVQRDGLQTVYLADPSAHLHFTGDWRAYVAGINFEAERWLKGHRLGENHGYSLTSTSESEFTDLQKRRKKL
jgi:hypothetical protein